MGDRPRVNVAEGGCKPAQIQSSTEFLTLRRHNNGL